MEHQTNPELQLAFDYVQYTGKHVFLTGKAGTGKTTFLHNLKSISPKRMVVTAPTGVAAINAGGVTLHSFFQMPFSPYIPRDYLSGVENRNLETQGLVEGHWKMNREKINIIKSMDLLVIDEISMVRADILDQVDAVLRRYKNRNKIFGGVQLLMIGDIHQLAPVIKDEEWNLLKRYYDTIFFFGSKALQKASIVNIELKHIYRQADESFINVLNKIRNNKLDEESRNILSKRYIPGFRPDNSEGYITLTTHNAQSRDINEQELKKLKSPVFEFEATVQGEFPEYSYPTDLIIRLKPGSQVMFVKNDPSKLKQYFNGKIGKITKIIEEQIHVQCPGNSDEIIVERQTWQNMKYTIDEETKDIHEEEVGSFNQYPIKLAWAITIHKSQGLTFDKAIIDANAAFAHGQVYVALSRCKTLEGLVLSSPLSSSGIISNLKVNEFSNNIEQNPPKREQLLESKKEYQHQLLKELFDFVPIIQKMYSGKKIMKEHDLEGTELILQKIDTIIDAYKVKIVQVSEKFGSQLNQLMDAAADVETDVNCQDRIKKASVYFHENIVHVLVGNISQYQLITDNKSIKNQLKKYRDELDKQVQEKLDCLELCKQGFTVKAYTETRAKSSIDTAKSKQVTEKEEFTAPATISHPELFKKLVAWRNLKAKELNQSHFMIMHQITIHHIVELLPVSYAKLNTIHGFGKKKIQQFGADIIEIVRAYAKENKLETAAYDEIPEPKKEKVDTKKVSYDMFKEGKSIAEIAKEREMAETTIEGHLAHYVGIGELLIETFVSKEKLEFISEYFLSNDSIMLTPAKEALGESYSYGELKLVLKHLQFKGEIKTPEVK